MVQSISNKHTSQLLSVTGEGTSQPSLPTELLMMILIYIGSVKEVLKCSLVCRSWRNVCESEFLWKNIVQASPLQSMILKVNGLECKSSKQYRSFFCFKSTKKMKSLALRKTHTFYDKPFQTRICCFHASKNSLLFASDLSKKQYGLTFRSFKDNVDVTGPVFDQPITQVVTSNQNGFALMETDPHSDSKKGIIQCWDLHNHTTQELNSGHTGFVNHMEMHDELLFYANSHQITAIKSNDPFAIDSSEKVFSSDDFIFSFCINNTHLFAKTVHHTDFLNWRSGRIMFKPTYLAQVDIETQKSVHEYDLWFLGHFASSGNLLVSEHLQGFNIYDVRDKNRNVMNLGSKKKSSHQIAVINECIYDLESEGVLKIWDLRMPSFCLQPKLDQAIMQLAYVENLFLLASINNMYVYSLSEMTMKTKVTSFVKNKIFN